MVHAGFYAAADTPSGANGSASTLFFSDESAPETFTATNFIQFDPGDGERFSAVVGFQNQLFVFKSTKMYVLYGVAPDDDGLPLPQYRTITLPDPIYSNTEPTLWNPVTVGPDGIYIATKSGLWKTTGNTPTRVPIKVNAVFSGRSNSSIANFALNVPGQLRLYWSGEKLWVMGPGAGSGAGAVENGMNLFWDTRVDAWGQYNLGSTYTPQFTSQGSVTPQGAPNFIFADVGLGAGIQLYQEQFGFQAGDLSGSAFSPSSYWTGYFDLGQPGEKRIRFVDVYADGTSNASLQVVGVGRRALTGGSVSPGNYQVTSNLKRVRMPAPLSGRQFRLELGFSDLFGVANGSTALPNYKQIEVRYSQGTTV